MRKGLCTCLASLLLTCTSVTNLLAQEDLRLTPMVKAIKSARPSVVNIHSQKNVGSVLAPNRQSGMGTGVVVDERGYIVTNYHVIEDVSSVRCSTLDGESYPTKVIARDPVTDLALLKIEPKSAMKVMRFGNSEDLMHGETVIAIGNAFGYQHTVSSGIVSELHRPVRLSDDQVYDNLIQTDASINPGNSGGPLINIKGEMIGLNVAIRAGAQGIGFAIPVDTVKQVLVRLMSSQTLNQTWHGIVCDTQYENDNSRVVVNEIERGSPAEQAGLRANDTILNISQVEVICPHDIERAIIGRPAGTRCQISFLRNGQPQSAELMLVASNSRGKVVSSADKVAQLLGLRFAGTTTEHEVRKVTNYNQPGLRIADVRPNSLAARVGLQSHDILVGMNGYQITNVDHVRQVIEMPDVLKTGQVEFMMIRTDDLTKESKLYKGKIELMTPSKPVIASESAPTKR